MLQGFVTRFRASLLKENIDLTMMPYSITVKLWVVQKQNLFSIIFCQYTQHMSYVSLHLHLIRSPFLQVSSKQSLAVSMVLHCEEQHNSKTSPAFSLVFALDHIFSEQEHDNKSTNGL